MDGDQSSVTKKSGNSFYYNCLKVLSSFCVTQPLVSPRPIPSPEQLLSSVPCSTMLSRKEDLNPRETSSAVDALSTADTQT